MSFLSDQQNLPAIGEQPHIYAGRDLQAGGTWLGINRHGQFAALTNFREPGSINPQPGTASRGELPSQFLQHPELSVDTYFSRLQNSQQQYNGYNLLCGTATQLGYFSNRGASQSQLPPGTYGLSNGLIDTPWPKVATGKQLLADTVEGLEANKQPDQAETLAADLFNLLAGSEQAPDHQLPDTGVGLEWERTLSPRFIQGDIYGTRTSTVLLFQADGSILFYERNFNPREEITSQSRELFNPC